MHAVANMKSAWFRRILFGLFIVSEQIVRSISSDFVKWVQHDKFFELTMINRAGGVIDIIVGDDDLLDRIVNTGKSWHFPLIGFVLRYTVSDLYEILFPFLYSEKIDLPPFVAVNGHFIAPKEQFVQYDIFKIVCQVKPAPGYADTVEGNVFIVKLIIVIQDYLILVVLVQLVLSLMN